MTAEEMKETSQSLDEMFIGYLLSKVELDEVDPVYSCYLNLKGVLEKDKPPNVDPE